MPGTPRPPRLVQALISSNSSSSSSDSMQEDEEEEAAPHAEEQHSGAWTKPMLADMLKRRKLSRAQDDHALARELLRLGHLDRDRRDYYLMVRQCE